MGEAGTWEPCLASLPCTLTAGLPRSPPYLFPSSCSCPLGCDLPILPSPPASTPGPGPSPSSCSWPLRLEPEESQPPGIIEPSAFHSCGAAETLFTRNLTSNRSITHIRAVTVEGGGGRRWGENRPLQWLLCRT